MKSIQTGPLSPRHRSSFFCLFKVSGDGWNYHSPHLPTLHEPSALSPSQVRMGTGNGRAVLFEYCAIANGSQNEILSAHSKMNGCQRKPKNQRNSKHSVPPCAHTRVCVLRLMRSCSCHLLFRLLCSRNVHAHPLITPYRTSSSNSNFISPPSAFHNLPSTFSPLNTHSSHSLL